MRIAHSAAAVAAAGVLVLAGAAPVVAADPVPSVSPAKIAVEGGFTATLTGCGQDTAFIQTDLLPEDPFIALDRTDVAGTFAKTFAGTDKNVEPGVHKVTFTCGEEGGTPVGSVDITVVARPAPKFTADIRPHRFRPGDRLTVRTSGCPTLPTVQDVDGLFAAPVVLHGVGGSGAVGSALTRRNLSRTKVYHVIVTCKDVASFTFSTAPGRTTMKHKGGQTGVVPVGGVETGDGSSLHNGHRQR